MPRGLTEYQKTVLNSIALNGSQHILSIQEKTGLNYATTHRSIKTLEQCNHIWLQEKEPRGPKGAQYYGLTPYGVVELYLRGIKQDLDTIIKKWETISPRFIIDHKQIEQKIPIKSILETIYPDIVQPYRIREKIPWREQLLIIHKNIIEQYFLNTLEITQLKTITEVIKNDLAFLKTWKHWFSLKCFIHQYLTEINQEIVN